MGLIKTKIAHVHAAIQHVTAAAEQSPRLDRWRTLLDYIFKRIVEETNFPALGGVPGEWVAALFWDD